MAETIAATVAQSKPSASRADWRKATVDVGKLSGGKSDKLDTATVHPADATYQVVIGKTRGNVAELCRLAIDKGGHRENVATLTEGFTFDGGDPGVLVIFYRPNPADAKVVKPEPTAKVTTPTRKPTARKRSAK